MRFAILLLLLLPGFAAGQMTYPDRIEPDNAHAPFYHGVASGDPLTDRVILWTRITPASLPSAALNVNWEIATDSAFATVINSGSFLTDSLRDWTVKVDAGGLQPYTDYYYRFDDGNGNLSLRGHTRTAPSTAQDHLRMGVASCSSVWSGYFNAYRRMGERDLDLVIHLGDYIYDYADANEEVRMPSPMFPDPTNLKEWRDIHAYYCLDLDFRFLKQQHAMAVLWDNHDLDSDSAGLAAAIQAWWEWTPARMPDSLNAQRIYRTLHYGPSADLFLVDVLLYRDTDTMPNGEPVFIGHDQFNWLSSELQNSNAQWKLLGNENMMAQFSLSSLPGWVPFGDGPVLDSSAWDGYGAERLRLLQFIESNGIDNVMVLSGDAHLPFGADLDPDPNNAASYDPNTGTGAVAVELLPCSITRGNLDEMGLGFAESIVAAVAENDNPHHVFVDYTHHGYGLLHLMADSAVGELWFSEVLSVESSETFAGGLVLRDGDNHWQQALTANPLDTALTSAAMPAPEIHFTLFPNPCKGEAIEFISNERPVEIALCDLQGRTLPIQSMMLEPQGGFFHGRIVFAQPLPEGMYSLRVNGNAVLFVVSK